MLRFDNGPAKTKWCHVVWPTYKRRELFKIPATARFCERRLRDRCTGRGWHMDTAFLDDTQVHVLLRAPARLSRRAVTRILQRTAGRALRQTGAVPRWDHRLWDRWIWCSVLSSAPAVEAVRKWLMGKRGELPWGIATPLLHPTGGGDGEVLSSGEAIVPP
jgi:REP element-mobilizing transposase RayT